MPEGKHARVCVDAEPHALPALSDRPRGMAQ